MHITDFVAVPEDFIIEDHMSIRNRMGFFKYPDFISLDVINKTNAVVKTTGYINISIMDAQNINRERQAVASAAAYLMCLNELGLIVESFKKFSFKTLLWKNDIKEAFGVFISDLETYNNYGATVHIVNIFPLIQNSKFYLENAIESLLKLDDIELDRQETSDRIGNLD